MKTLKNKKGNKFMRVPNKNATDIQGIKELLAKGWTFCPKSEWIMFEIVKKESVRDKR